MRRMLFVAVLAGLGFASQQVCEAGHGRGNDCGRPVCNPLPHVVDTLGFSYFRNHCNPCFSGHCGGVRAGCPPYIYPNRAPRDFWMLR